MNVTLRVGSFYECDKLFHGNTVNTYNLLWTQTVTGCKIVQLLQDIYKFNITYIISRSQLNKTLNFGGGTAMYPQVDDNIDVYTRPMSLRPLLLDYGYPVQALKKWRFGFVLRRPETVNLFQSFYSKPFTRPLWNCLYAMAFIITLLLYLLKKWEVHILGYVHDQGISYEMLMVFGAYCQHIPPLHAILSSRRTVYFVFFMFAYVIYSFYTCNLLSHLVNDKDIGIDLTDLSKSKYEFAVVNDFKNFKDFNISMSCDRMSVIEKKLRNIQTITISEGLERVKFGEIALLSDYSALNSYAKYNLKMDDLCKLTTVDLLTNVKRYFFTSKYFKFKEQFKIGTLQALETGLLKRIVNGDSDILPIHCETNRLVQAQIFQISSLLFILFGFYVSAVVILICERIHYKRNRFWPYME